MYLGQLKAVESAEPGIIAIFPGVENILTQSLSIERVINEAEKAGVSTHTLSSFCSRVEKVDSVT
jgi:hypothetical protein